MARTSIEKTAERVMLAHKIPAWRVEFAFARPRRWRFDFAWPEQMVALEVEGGIWVAGRHSRPTGYAADCEKYNEAAIRGWKVIRATGDHVKSGEFVGWVKRALGLEQSGTTGRSFASGRRSRSQR
jgi:very-short-patch-repair endonuclease